MREAHILQRLERHADALLEGLKIIKRGDVPFNNSAAERTHDEDRVAHAEQKDLLPLDGDHKVFQILAQIDVWIIALGGLHQDIERVLRSIICIDRPEVLLVELNHDHEPLWKAASALCIAGFLDAMIASSMNPLSILADFGVGSPDSAELSRLTTSAAFGCLAM